MPQAKDLVMHSVLKKEGFTIMASDILEQGNLIEGNNISLIIIGISKEEIETYYSKLLVGGKINHVLKEEFFGIYGDLIDKFGINWMFEADKTETQ
jgi:PhnB protein